MSSVSTPGTGTLPGRGMELLTFIVRRRGGEYFLTRMMEELAFLWPNRYTVAGWSSGSESRTAPGVDRSLNPEVFPVHVTFLRQRRRCRILMFWFLDLTSWDMTHEAI